EAGNFTLDDFKRQIEQISRPGLMKKMIGMMPGMGDLAGMLQNSDHEKEMRRLRGIIDSMTSQERRTPKVITPARRQRIAAGAGTTPQKVNELLKQFDTMSSMMKGASPSEL